MKMIAVDSSMITSVGYDEKTKELHVHFANKDKGRYTDVPADAWQGLLGAIRAGRSVGSFFHQCIRPRYEYERIEPDDAPADEGKTRGESGQEAAAESLPPVRRGPQALKAHRVFKLQK